jgi:tryptophanyl-tRNA synthetase
VACKKNLSGCISGLLEPMRERRNIYNKNPQLVKDIIYEGTKKAHRVARETMLEVRDAMGINYFGGK